MEKTSKPSFSDILKNIFFLLIIIQLAPPIIQGIVKQYKNLMEQRTKVAVLPINGILYNSDPYCKKLRQLFEDKSIKAILIKMECSGGASGTSQTIFDELKALKKESPKPIVVLVENICASGGYNIACATDYIIAPGSAIIGSIGASLPYLFNIKELLERINVKYTPIAAGAYKNVANPFVDLTPQDKSLLQGVADDAYDQFIREVSESRKLSLASSKEWADGKIFTGRQAKKLGLIDEVGSLENAIQIIKKKAMIEGLIEWVHPPVKFSFWNFFRGDSGQEEESSMFASMASQIGNYLEQRYSAKAIA